MQLDPTAAAAGTRLVTHDSIDSTNAEALRLARAGERGPLWVTAPLAAETAGASSALSGRIPRAKCISAIIMALLAMYVSSCCFATSS